MVRLYRDLVALRSNRAGQTRGLTAWGCKIARVDEGKNVLAYHRYEHGGPGDDVVVVANFSHQPHKVPHRYARRRRLAREAQFRLDALRKRSQSSDLAASGSRRPAWDEQPASLELNIPAYSVIILSQ